MKMKLQTVMVNTTDSNHTVIHSRSDLTTALGCDGGENR